MNIETIEETLTKLATKRADDDTRKYRRALVDLLTKANDGASIKFETNPFWLTGASADAKKPDMKISLGSIWTGNYGGKVENPFIEGIIQVYFRTRLAHHYKELKAELLTKCNLLEK